MTSRNATLERAVRRALHEDREGRARDRKVDKFSSAFVFDGWIESWATPASWQLPADYKPLPVRPPESWALREGWRRHDGLIATTEVPGPQAMREVA